LNRRLEELMRIQEEAASRVVVEDQFESPIEVVAGVDLAFSGNDGIAACVAMNHLPTKVIEVKILVMPLEFPYIPTFLTFREGPPILRIMSSLRTKVDVFLINGQGIAHPLRCGLASHVGVESGNPTIGVTTSRLVGEYDHEPRNEGEAVPLRSDGERVGWVLKSRSGSRPIFVSPGHRVGLDSSLRIVRACLLGHKLPEPLRLAHVAANREKRKLQATKTGPGHQ